MPLDYVDVGGTMIGGIPATDPMFYDYFSLYGAPAGVYDFGQPYIPDIQTINEPFGAPQGDVRVLNFPTDPSQPSIVPQQFGGSDYFDLYSQQGLFTPPPPSMPSSFFDDGAIDNMFVDTDTGALVDSGGQIIASPEEFMQQMDLIDPLVAQTQQIQADPSLSPAQKQAATQSLWSRSNELLGSPVGKMLATLAIGGIGLGISQLVAGGGDDKVELPQPAPPPAAVTASRDALNQALTTPGGVSGSASLAGLGAANLPAGQQGALASALGPSQTAGQDLQSLFRQAIAGQRNVTDLALGRSAQEILADVEQDPYERAIRMQSLGEIPGLLGPSAGVAPTIQTGLNLSQALQGLQAPQPGQTIVPSMLQDPTGQQLTQQVQGLLGQRPAIGSMAADPVRDAMTARLQGLLSQGSQGAVSGDPLQQQLASRAGEMLTQGGPGQGYMLDDPIRMGLQDQLQRALAGNLPTEGLERQFRQEEVQLRNRLHQQQGPGYESDHAGIQALQALRESQQARREEFGRQTIASLAPQEFQRRQFATAFPEQQYQQRLGLYLPQELARRQFSQQQYLNELGLLGPQEAQRRQFGMTFPQNAYAQQLSSVLPAERQSFQFGVQQPQTQYLNMLNSLLPAELQRAQFGEDVRQQGLANRAGLSQLGRTDMGQLTTTLGSIVPISPILGLGTEAEERSRQNALNTQAALASFNLQAQERQRLAGGIGGIFGSAAESLTAPDWSRILERRG